jgi:hypothetical protein
MHFAYEPYAHCIPISHPRSFPALGRGCQSLPSPGAAEPQESDGSSVRFCAFLRLGCTLGGSPGILDPGGSGHLGSGRLGPARTLPRRLLNKARRFEFRLFGFEMIG